MSFLQLFKQLDYKASGSWNHYEWKDLREEEEVVETYLQVFWLFHIAHSYRNLPCGEKCVLPNGLGVLQGVSGGTPGVFKSPTLTRMIRMNSGSDPEEFYECQKMLRLESM